MQKVRATLSTYIANRLLKGDQLILETKDKSTHKTKEFVVEIIRITSDIPRCSGCTCFLKSEDEIHKFANGIYCDYCFQKRIDKQREITQLSANKKGLK
jgi:hypothetical protein